MTHVLREEPSVPVVLELDVARGGVVMARNHHLQRPRVLRVALELARLQNAYRFHVPGRAKSIIRRESQGTEGDPEQPARLDV